jgi:hypothetical protein
MLASSDELSRSLSSAMLAMPSLAVAACRRVAISALAIVLALSAASRAPAATAADDTAERENFAGRLEFDGASDFSHIRIRRRGDVRSMLFVRDWARK